MEEKIKKILPIDYYSKNGGYTISSLYFDDVYDTSLNDSLSGNANRDKYRIRIYNNSFENIKLEIKRKRYNKAIKISGSITKKEMKLLMNGNTINNTKSNKAVELFNLAINTRGLRPKIIVTYDRDAYVYENGNVRITFDRKIRACRQVDLFGEELTYDYLEDNDNVLEVKYDEFIPKFISSILESGKMIQTSNSKYGLCRELYSM